MKSLFIINEHMSSSQLEQSYLLILALLNFEHDVDLVFIDKAYDRICNNIAIKKQWHALKLYGVGCFYHFGNTNPSLYEELAPINTFDFEQLKIEADWLS